ncbi:LOW QUALITY PROTEIN: ornithine decarboxylase antizyme 3 [Carettochelys insculpta]|uniref:LOW QUALITY PROTEIN: ornithine decarboxylase antizyme 3 n=1 Tax=Carettochelys insculpta TaxID=44489 RepID=UPI003EBD7434
MSQWPGSHSTWLFELGPGAQGSLCRGEALPEETSLLQDRTYLFSLSYTEKGKKRNYLYPICSPFAYYYYCYRYRLIYRRRMVPFHGTITMTEHESLTLRPRPCLQCSESLGSSPPGRGANQGELRELYKAGNLTVFVGNLLLPGFPVQLDFHFQLGPHSSAHWHGLLTDNKLFLDTPRSALDQNNRQSLTATLEYVEEETAVSLVFVNFQLARSDRGDLLRTFSYLGFEVVRPDHPLLPPWEDVIFMVYPMERDCCLQRD